MQSNLPGAGLSSLEQLPVELFRQITGYLAFFDKKAMQLTSKACYNLMVNDPFVCPHILLWFLHLCRSEIPSRPDSNLNYYVFELEQLIIKHLTSDTWIDLSQGPGARDAHTAFQQQWSTYLPLELSDDVRDEITSTLIHRARTSRPCWQKTETIAMRVLVIYKILLHLLSLRSGHNDNLIWEMAALFEWNGFNRAPDRATYVAECRRSSSEYVPPLLQPYFDEAFPKSTVAHFCLGVVIKHAERIVARAVDFSEPFGEGAQWRRVLRRARIHVENLDTWTHADGRTRFAPMPAHDFINWWRA